jgi:hypothetical protein
MKTIRAGQTDFDYQNSDFEHTNIATSNRVSIEKVIPPQVKIQKGKSNIRKLIKGSYTRN